MFCLCVAFTLILYSVSSFYFFVIILCVLCLAAGISDMNLLITGRCSECAYFRGITGLTAACLADRHDPHLILGERFQSSDRVFGGGNIIDRHPAVISRCATAWSILYSERHRLSGVCKPRQCDGG